MSEEIMRVLKLLEGMTEDVQRAQKVLAAEQVVVLDALRAVSAEKQEIDKRRRELSQQSAELVARGVAAGLPQERLAEALGVSRQAVAKIAPRVQDVTRRKVVKDITKRMNR